MAAPSLSAPTFSEIARNFAPGWFASVMGTGVLAMTTHALAARWPLLEPVSWGLHYFNLALFALLAVPWLTRWIAYREEALAALRHPVQASFTPTFSIAMLVVAAQFLAFGQQVDLALLFWWPGMVLTFVFSFAVLFAMFSGEHVALEHVTPAMFIPAVGLVVIPLAGGPLAGQLPSAAHDLALLACVLGLGAGLMMYVGLLGLTLQRNFLAKPAFGALAPTVWIHLAPLGVIPLSLLNLVEQLPFPVPAGVFLVFGLLFWGFGMWWVVMATLLTLAARRRGQLPFALSWWAFTFPLGAFVALSFRLSRLSGLFGVELAGIACWGLLAALWLATLANTLRGFTGAAGGAQKTEPG